MNQDLRSYHLTNSNNARTIGLDSDGAILADVLVTPQLAAKWLEQPARNRTLSKETVAAYARDMLAGRWQTSHQGIAITKDCCVVDGQHRLWAIVETGKPIRMRVTFGVDERTMAVVDTGRVRSAADIGRIVHGSGPHGRSIALARAIESISRGNIIPKMTPAEALALVEQHQKLISWALQWQKNHASAAVVGAMAYAYATHPKEVDSFMRQFVSRADIPARSPVLALIRANDTTIKGDAERWTLVLKTMFALHAYIEDRPLDRIQPFESGLRYFQAARKQRRIAA